MVVTDPASSAQAPQASDPGRYDAFLSYAREDSPFVVDYLREALRERGHEVWVDVDITGGANWRERVRRGIEACKAFIFIISRDSVASEACAHELAAAVELNKLIIPVVHRRDYTGALPPALADAEWVLFRDGDDLTAGLDRLVEALETDLPWRDEHTRLAGRAREWLDSERDNSYLLRGSDLREAESWLAQQGDHRQAPTREQSEYIVRSRQAAGRRLYTLIGGLALGLAITVGLSIFALIQRSSAKHEAKVATARQLAALSGSELGSNLNIAMPLAVRAYRMDPNPQTRAALLQADLSSPSLVRYMPMGGQVAALAGSADRSTVVAGLNDGRVMRERLDAHARSRIASLGGAVTSLAVNTNGRVVAATSGLRGALWRAGGRTSTLSCPAPQHPEAVGVSPSGRTVAVYCVAAIAPLPSHSVVMINGSTGGVDALHPLPASGTFPAPQYVTPGVAMAGVILPSDQSLLLFSVAGSWQWWALASWSLSVSATIGAAAHDIAQGYSADGRYMTVTNGATTMSVWPTSVPYTQRTDAPLTAEAPIDSPSAITLSPRGGKLAVADSGTVYVSPVTAVNKPRQSPVQLPGNGSVNSGGVTFFGDDTHLLSASGSAIAMWDLNQLDRLATVQTSVLPASCIGCAGALTVVSPNGQDVAAVANNGGSAVVQALDGRHAPYVLNATGGSGLGPPVWQGERLLLPIVGTSPPTGRTSAARIWSAVPTDDWIAAAAPSGDGHSVTIVDGSGNIYIEDPDTGRIERRIAGPRDLARSTTRGTLSMAAIDSHHGLVALVDHGGTYLYNLSSSAVLKTLPGGNASFVAFAGDRLLVQRSDGSLEVWGRRGEVLERTLPGDESYGYLYPVADTGGNVVARRRSDGSTTVADLGSGATLARFAAPAPRSQGLKIGLAFSPDGRRLISVVQLLATGASEIVTHDLSAGTAIRVACAAAGGGLTASEWRRYVGTTPPSDLRCR